MGREIDIINHFGLSNQMKKFMEECYELVEAMWEDDGSEKALEHIREEWHDVKLVMQQFYDYFELYKDEDKNKSMYEYKIERTFKVIEDDKSYTKVVSYNDGD